MFGVVTITTHFAINDCLQLDDTTYNIVHVTTALLNKNFRYFMEWWSLYVAWSHPFRHLLWSQVNLQIYENNLQQNITHSIAILIHISEIVASYRISRICSTKQRIVEDNWWCHFQNANVNGCLLLCNKELLVIKCSFRYIVNFSVTLIWRLFILNFK